MQALTDFFTTLFATIKADFAKIVYPAMAKMLNTMAPQAEHI